MDVWVVAHVSNEKRNLGVCVSDSPPCYLAYHQAGSGLFENGMLKSGDWLLVEPSDSRAGGRTN